MTRAHQRLLRAGMPNIGKHPSHYYNRNLTHMNWNVGEYEDSPEYQYFSKHYDSHLALKTLAVLLLAAFISLFVFYLWSAYHESEQSRGQVIRLIEGPVAIFAIAGLIGLGLIYAYYGGQSGLYNAIYAPFLLIISFILFWANTEKGNAMQNPEWKVTELHPETLVWGGIVVLVLVNAVMTFIRGEMRLDALNGFSSGSIAFVSVAILLTLGLSHIFELVIQTLKLEEVDENSSAFLSVYGTSIAVVFFVIAVLFKIVNIIMTILSGHWQTEFAPPTGLGASYSILQTYRAYRLSVYIIVIITAALIWRRHALARKNRVQDQNQDQSQDQSQDQDQGNKDQKPPQRPSRKDIHREWYISLVSLIGVPLVAVITELMIELKGLSPVAYGVLKNLFVSIVVIMIGTGIIPWNNSTIMVALFGVSVLALQFLGNNRYRNVFTASLILSVMFSLVRLAYSAISGKHDTGGDDDDDDEGEGEGDSSQPVTSSASGSMFELSANQLTWMMLVGVLLVIVEFYAWFNDGYVNPAISAVMYLFPRMVVMYTLFLFTTDDFKSMGADLIEGNKPASYAADTLVMTCALFSTTLLVLVTNNSMHNYDVNYATYTGVSRKKGKIMDSLVYWVIGGVAAHMFHFIRKSDAIVDYFYRSQLTTEEVYTKVYRDMFGAR